MRLSVNDLEKVAHKEFRNRDQLRGKKVSGVSTDTRTLESGNLFFALRGEHFDGHKFIGDAIAKGAVAAVVEAVDLSVDSEFPVLVVDNTTRTLGELANIYRRKFSLPILAVGGSNGKTTTKDMIAHVLGRSYRVLKTEGNLNNQIGVPMTLFLLEGKHKAAVVEIGTNHPGEIEYLCRILEPTDGLLTNIGHEHLEFFKTLDGVAREEGALLQWLKSKGRVFANADDDRIRTMVRRVKNRYTYGFDARNVRVRGRIAGEDARSCVRFEFRGKQMKKSVGVQLGVPGRHNAQNALAAAAVGLAYKVPVRKIREALETFRASSKRMEVVDIGGVTVYNDAYNANPDSTIEALRTLALARVKGKKIAVLGDMLELGDQGPEQHARVGREASRVGIDCLLTFGELAKQILETAQLPWAIHYDQKNMLAEYLAELVTPGDAVLVKGSRGMKMEDIVTFLVERNRQAPGNG